MSTFSFCSENKPLDGQLNNLITAEKLKIVEKYDGSAGHYEQKVMNGSSNSQHTI